MSVIITGSLIVLMVVLSVTGSMPALGQGGALQLSNEDMTSFVHINHRMITIQSELEERMVKAIEEQGLTVEQYIEIVISQENPESEKTATEKELEKVKTVNEQVDKLNTELQAKSLEVIAEAGLTVERYEEIANAVEGSRKAQEQYNELMEELMKGGNLGEQNEEALG